MGLATLPMEAIGQTESENTHEISKFCLSPHSGPLASGGRHACYFKRLLGS